MKIFLAAVGFFAASVFISDSAFSDAIIESDQIHQIIASNSQMASQLTELSETVNQLKQEVRYLRMEVERKNGTPVGENIYSKRKEN